MRVLEFIAPGQRAGVGVLLGDGVYDLTTRHPDRARSMHHLLNQPDWRDLVASAKAVDFAVDDIEFSPLLAQSGRVFAIGLNYAKKYPAGGTPPPTPQFPPWFTKVPGTLVGHLQPLVAPRVSPTFDYESELAAVIGRRARHVPVESALDVVAGWTIVNDGSVREWQRHSVSAGKNFERSGSIGPWMVTSDEIADPQALRLVARVDGEVRQDASTGEMIKSVAQIISYLSTALELLPGDVIATGSPEGSGGGFDPPRWLTPGRVVECEVEGIGVLRNPVIGES